MNVGQVNCVSGFPSDRRRSSRFQIFLNRMTAASDLPSRSALRSAIAPCPTHITVSCKRGFVTRSNVDLPDRTSNVFLLNHSSLSAFLRASSHVTTPNIRLLMTLGSDVVADM